MELEAIGEKGTFDEIKIASAYARNNAQYLLDNSKYYYINDNIKKTKNWLKRTRLQLPVGINQFGLIDTIISTKTQKINTNLEKSDLENHTDAVNDSTEVRFSTKEPLSTQIDHVLSGADTNTTHVYVGKTFEVLKELGLKDMPMLITSDHVYSIIKTEDQARKEGKYKKKANYHGLGKEKFLDVIERLQDPAFIIKSNNDDTDARIVLVTNVMDNESHYIVGAIQPNGYGTIDDKIRKANIILSVYGKKNLNRFIQKAYQEDRIIKINPERTVIPRVQFPNDIFNQDYVNNLAHYKTIVNNNISKNRKNDTYIEKSNKNLRYSLKNEEGSSLYASKEDDFAWMEDILKEEPDIKETASILQEGTEALRKAKKAPDAAEVRKISRSILEDIGSQYDLDTFSSAGKYDVSGV